jgi:cytochrome c556
MRSPRFVATVSIAICLGASGCAFGSYLLRSEQRTLIKTLMRDLDSANKQLEDSADKGRWDAVVRISEEMAEKARRLESIEPREGVGDFQMRSVELEHDLRLIAGEAAHQNSEAVETHLKNLEFTCDGCHRKFKYGRPW